MPSPPEPLPTATLPDLMLAPGRPLPVARYRFVFRMREALRLPDFAGSLLRGQFGAALRRTACITKARTCPGCPLLATCPYPSIFETPAPASHRLQKFGAVPNPYVIEPPPIGTRAVAASDTLSFNILLVGRAIGQLPLVAYAFARAMREGLGPDRARGDLEDVQWEDVDGYVSIWDSDARRLCAHAPALRVPAFGSSTQADLEIVTPLRLQHNGRPLREGELSARTLVTTLVRRAELLFEFHAGIPSLGVQAPDLARHAQTLHEERVLQWHDWTRYSSRQKQTMTLGGVLGTWTLHGELRPLLPWLWLGQWIHVGKNATMGLGRYTLHVSN